MRLSEGVDLRPAVAADVALLHRIYCSTRQQELAAVNWSHGEQDAFLQQQFDLQHRYYHAHFPQAQFCIIQCEAQDIGRFYLDRAGAELRLIDIALLPDWRGRGIGSHLLRSLLDEADECGRHILLHVDANNPVLGFYQRLGFEALASNGVYVKLSRRPKAGAAAREYG